MGYLLMIILFICTYGLWRWTMIRRNDDKDLPPSPSGWMPILGHLWRLDARQPFKTIDVWSKQLGDVFSLFFGAERVVVISRQRLIKEAFLTQGHHFSGRPHLFVHRSCWGQGHVISDGPESVEMRKFIMSTIRDSGVSSELKVGLQNRVKMEVESMLEEIDKKLVNKRFADIDIEDTVFFVVGNVLTSLVLGRTYPHGSDEFRKNSEWLTRTMELMEKTSALTFLPWLRFVPPSGLGYWQMKRQAKTVNDMMTADIQNRVKTKDYQNLKRTDLTSCFLRKIDEIEAKESKNETESICYTKVKLARIMTEMFFAGIQTEVNTFGWAFLYFIHFPHVQDKCRKEIFSQIGDGRLVNWEDRVRLPYLEATVAEIQRHASIAPFAVFHRTLRETTLDGYRIPANSTVMMNLWTTLRDPAYFAEPDDFNPERFMDVENEEKCRVRGLENVIPYGVGRRICMGETLARLELFIIIAALLQRYRFDKVPDAVYSLQQNMQLTIHAEKYQVRVEKL